MFLDKVTISTDSQCSCGLYFSYKVVLEKSEKSEKYSGAPLCTVLNRYGNNDIAGRIFQHQWIMKILN